MELFDELKNKHILASIELINWFYDEKVTIPFNDFDAHFRRVMNKESLNVGYDYVEQLKKDYGIFRKDKAGQVRLADDTGIEIRPGMPEKIWLKSMLEHPAIQLFLENQTVAKLKLALKDVVDYQLNQAIIRKGQSGRGDTIDKSLIEKLQILIQAIDEERLLIYSNQSKNGETFQGKKAVVYKIEYSIIEDRFRASLWSLDEERPFKANLSQLSDLSLGEPVLKSGETLKNILEKRRAPEPLQLKITNVNNCVERAVLLFSQYERIARWEADGTLLMEIAHYSFDEEELFRNILSLGPMALVLQPTSLRKRVIDTLTSK